MRTLIYSRVSTSDKGQNPEVQINELRRFCVNRGWTVVEEIVDHGFSGTSDKRPGLTKLMKLARARTIDVVVVTKLDRFARSLKHLVSSLDEFSSLGVLFVSISDQIDLTTASGRLMLHLLAAFAEFERCLLVERTLLGLAYARSKGKRLGRPPMHATQPILELRAQGLSYRAIARQLNVPMGTITRAIKTAHKTPTNPSIKKSEKSGGGGD